MPMMTVEIPDAMMEFVEQQVKRFGYESASEYIEELFNESAVRERQKERAILPDESIFVAGKDEDHCS
jgi:Arc/MetJ-type ribon-helix-helix transcriptional regulator